MGDLYDQLEELQGMTRVLTGDVIRLRPKLGSVNVQDVSDEEETARRLYIRAVFSLIEALVEHHKQLLLHLADRNTTALSPVMRGALSEGVYFVRDNGTAAEWDSTYNFSASFARSIAQLVRVW